MYSLPKNVALIEVGPRDRLQNEKYRPVRQKETPYICTEGNDQFGSSA